MGRKKKNTNKLRNTKENTAQVEAGGALKFLCLFSTIGFVISMLVDAGNYVSFSSIEELKKAVDQTQYEILETKIDLWQGIGIDTSIHGLKKVANMYAIRALIDVFAMLGVTLMFYKTKLGFIIYTISQFIYIAIPLFFFGSYAFFIVPYTSAIINLIYVALFASQYKYLTR